MIITYPHTIDMIAVIDDRVRERAGERLHHRADVHVARRSPSAARAAARGLRCLTRGTGLHQDPEQQQTVVQTLKIHRDDPAVDTARRVDVDQRRTRGRFELQGRPQRVIKRDHHLQLLVELIAGLASSWRAGPHDIILLMLGIDDQFW